MTYDRNLLVAVGQDKASPGVCVFWEEEASMTLAAWLITVSQLASSS